MTRKIQQRQQWVKLPLAAAIAATLSTPAAAFQFYLGDVEASFDTTLTAGAGWRVEDQDRRLIAQGNLSPEDAPYGSSSNNFDDGNLNFKKGDTYSKIVKGTSELYLNYNVDSEYLTRIGGFLRGRYWYDFELKDESRAVDANGYSRPLNEEASDNASGGEFLDAYIFSDWYFGDTPVSVRYGKQVLSWGESTFIQGGINVINPVDVNAIRAPGAELKDALLPVEMLYSSIGLTENVTLEAFLQTDWEKVRPDDCGTFFSTNDFAADGCGPVLLAGQTPDAVVYEDGVYAPRVGDREPDDRDQFGAAIRWYVPELNDSELGFYYIRYHSRLPYVSGIVNDPDNRKQFPSYYIEYPEGINLYGVSINTTIPGGWSLGAEYSFRDNMPIQWNAFELIYGGLQYDNPALPGYQPASLLQVQREEEAGVAVGTGALAGQETKGYDRFKVSQAQFTLIKFFDQVMGASRLTFVGEVGATYVHGLPDYDEARYGRSGNFGIGQVEGGGCQSLNINTSYCNNEGFTTSFSWGYRTRFVWDYPNVFAGVNLSPQLAFSHDVQGYAPSPGGNFLEGRKAIGLSLTGVYQNRYSANVGYTNYFGGKPYNELTDRDFVNASVSVSF